jgi:hypothetical protein
MKKTSKQRQGVLVSEQRIKGKLAECEFFLDRMNESNSPQVFGYYLSAFLSAVSTLTVLGLMRNHGKSFNGALRQLRGNSGELDFLLNSRDVEVHREGVRIWFYQNSQPQSMSPRFRGGLWGDLLLTPRHESRYRSKFRPRFGDGMRVALERAKAAPAPNTFIFEDSGQDVVAICKAALDAVRLLGN